MCAAIYSAALACQNGLRTCADGPTPDDWAEERLFRFNFWSAASGALVGGRHGLDERLRASGAMHIVVANLLTILDKYITIYARQSQHHGASRASDDTTSFGCTSAKTSESWEGGLSFEKPAKRQARIPSNAESFARGRVECTFTQVVCVTKRVTRSLTQSMLWVFDSSLRKNEDGSEEDPDLRIYRDEMRRWVQARADRDLDKVQERLIEANVRRRHRFIVAYHNRPTPRGDRQERIAPLLERPQWLRRSNIQHPDPPVLPPDCKIFQCPYCCRDLPAFMADPEPWSRHIVADMCPFVCVSPDCSVRPNMLYANRADWEEHTYACLGATFWQCPDCQAALDSEDALKDHLMESHGCSEESCSASTIQEIVKASKKRTVPLLSCPLCPATPEPQDSLDHIARCLQDLAMESLYYPEAAPGRSAFVGLAKGISAQEGISIRNSPTTPLLDAGMTPRPTKLPAKLTELALARAALIIPKEGPEIVTPVEIVSQPNEVTGTIEARQRSSSRGWLDVGPTMIPRAVSDSGHWERENDFYSRDTLSCASPRSLRSQKSQASPQEDEGRINTAGPFQLDRWLKHGELILNQHEDKGFKEPYSTPTESVVPQIGAFDFAMSGSRFNRSQTPSRA